MRGLILLFAGVVVLICAPLIFFVTHWPFTEERVTQELKSGLASDVVIGHFRKIYVPYPGCVAENVIVRRAGPDVRPIATIGKLEIQYSWHAFLSGRRHLDEIRLDRLRIYRPLHASWPGAGKTASDAGSKFTVGEIIANGATLDIAHDEKPEP